MSKTIKLDNEVYRRLEEIRGKRETFSGAVERLLSVLEGFRMIGNVIGERRPQVPPGQGGSDEPKVL